MNRLLVLMLILLILPACSTRPVKDDSPASDLDVYQTAIQRTLEGRTLESGLLYCFELAKTEGAQDECTGELEDLAWLSEGDKVRALQLTDKFIQRQRLLRNPCGFFANIFNRKRCSVR